MDVETPAPPRLSRVQAVRLCGPHSPHSPHSAHSAHSPHFQKMIIYNVTVKVAHPIAAEWLRWMKDEHMPDILATGLFIESRLCRLLEQDETDGITYSAQYMCDSLE